MPAEWLYQTQLLELKAAQFRSLPSVQREPLALAVLPCLAAADPVLRDEIAFESLYLWRADAAGATDSIRGTTQPAHRAGMERVARGDFTTGTS